MSNIYSNNISNPKLYKAASKIILKNLNSSLNNLTPEELKFFFKRYHRNKNGIKILNESETDSTYTDLPENQNQLNAIYIHNLNSLNQFLQKQTNLRGLTLQGNRLLENISLNKFNEFFREYGKSIEKKLKKHVLNYFYPNNNQPKLMGQKMNLTPIPIKRNIYLKNEKEKKDIKNAERAAVILRRLEYTHGLSGNNNRDEKIFFYLMKGAALIIEDWWINIYLNKKKDDDYNKLLGKIKNLENVDKENNERNNRFILNNKKNKNGKKYNNYDKNYNYKNQALKYRKITPVSNLNKKKGKLKKNNKIEVVEINLNENQNNKTNISQTEPRNSVPINSNDDPILSNSAKNILIDENNIDKENEINKTEDKINNKENNNSNINNNKNLQKSMSAKHIYDNNKYEMIKEKIIKGNPIQLIVSNSLINENKNKNRDSNNNKIINNKPSKNKGLNRSAYNKISQNYNNYKMQIANKKIDLNNLILSKKLQKSSTAPRFISSSVRKEKNFPEKNIAKNIINKNKLFNEDNNISKTPNHSNINNNDNNKKVEKQKSQKCKIKNKNKSKLDMNSSGIKLFKQKDIKNKKNKNHRLNNSAFVMENNINISIVNEDKKNNNNKEKINNKLNINISNDDIFDKKEFENNNIKEEIICK